MSPRTDEPAVDHPVRNSQPPVTAARTPGATTLPTSDEDEAQP
ncbi:hypothetical protein ACFVAF_22410 [Streptomyces sp. NPDC057596]